MDLFKRHIWLLGLLLPALAFQVGGARASQEAPPAILVDGVECFVLEWPSDRPHPARYAGGSEALSDALAAGQIGLVEIRRRVFDGSPQLELEADFPFENIRLFAVECLSPNSPRLVWREVSGGAGRTVFAEWTAESEELRVLEWGLDGRLRERSATREGAVMPHYLLELAREGAVTTGSFEVFDPLCHELETWTLTTSYQREGQGQGRADYTRRAEFHRADGTLAGRYVFRGTELLRFQWQESGAVARRISASELAQLRARWGFSDTAEEGQPSDEESERSTRAGRPLDAAARPAKQAGPRVKDA